MSTSFAAGKLVAIVLLIVCCAPSVALATIVRFETSVGNVEVRLYNSATPNSVTNFLNYVNSGRYTSTFIHRVPQHKENGINVGTQHFVVQGGGFLLNNSIWSATGVVTDPPIGDEFRISNTRGTLAFAKNTLGATSQWFFSVGDNSFLDASNFTVFGRVLGPGMNVIDMIDNLPAANATVAENAPGEDFDEIPIRNPITQNDITNNEAVMINSVSVRNLPLGDYDFNGVVNAADYNVWRSTFGSTTSAEADGNGNGVVDAADYVIWRNLFAAGGGSLADVGIVPEPSTAALSLLAAAFATLVRRRRSKQF